MQTIERYKLIIFQTPSTISRKISHIHIKNPALLYGKVVIFMYINEKVHKMSTDVYSESRRNQEPMQTIFLGKIKDFIKGNSHLLNIILCNITMVMT